jgi:Ca2+-binding EF-hand superfamily protein
MDRHAHQLPAWKAQFDAFVVDKSGQISEAEFRKVLRGSGQVVPDDEATALFKSFDHDREGAAFERLSAAHSRLTVLRSTARCPFAAAGSTHTAPRKTPRRFRVEA